MNDVLFTGCTLSKEEIERLKPKGLLIKPARLNFSEDELIGALQGVEAYILGGEEIATKRVIESAKDLKIIAFYGAGHERYVDVKAATSRGIPVTNTPKANAYTTAEHTVALILGAVKQITDLSNSTKKGAWKKRQAWNLRGKTLGILGLGAVGSNVARIMRSGFGMKILYISRTPKPDLDAELEAKKVDLHEVMRKSDIVSIHLSYSDETVGMVGEEELNMMNSEAVLINTARAEIVDGLALYKALASDKIASAACDNYYVEPVPPPEKDKYKLMSLPDDKFILTPHTAYSSIETIQAMNGMVLESIISFFEGKVPKYIVNPGYKSRKECSSV